jgi:eukaryotic-like serine/threonine-protein kinase
VDSLDTLVHTGAYSPAPPSVQAARIRLSENAEQHSQRLVLDRYRLLERLGAGGFGVVWRAYDEQLQREVAVKRIALAPDGDRERASREAHATARLAHPAIVALYEACVEQDSFYLISELVPGDTLAALIARGTLPDEQVLEIGIALSEALAHAHARGVIHRDVKPQNVLVPDPSRADTRDSSSNDDQTVVASGISGSARNRAVAKLTDFGGASLAGEDALTRTGDVLGTLAYMAPEQSEGREVKESADLYSLALVLYEALSGVNPVRGPTPASTARRLGRPLRPLERYRGELPSSLTRALDRALQPSPGHRGTLGQLREVLERELAGEQRSEGERRAHSASEHHPPAGQERPREMAERERYSPSAGSRLALPRAFWLACAIAAILSRLVVGQPGVALLMCAAALPLAMLPRRVGPGWLAAALAPVLGLAGLAGAFPALAGQRRRWRARAALAALGYWWLTLAEPLCSRRLWLGPPAGASAHGGWEQSFASAAVHVVAPTLSLGVLLGAVLWAAGSMLLPLLVRGRSAMRDAVAATIWSAALILAIPLTDSRSLAHGLSAHAAAASPRGAVLGALVGCAFAVSARALRGPV